MSAPSIFDPTAPPYVRVENYSDGSTVVRSADFYNPHQDYIAYMFGAFAGQSCSMSCDEFLVTGVSNSTAVPAQYGTELLVAQSGGGGSGAMYSSSVAAGLSPGDHGVWSTLQGGTPEAVFTAGDNPCDVGTGNFLVSAKVKITRRAGLETAVNSGLWIGCGYRYQGQVLNGGDGLPRPTFQAASDKANWIADLDIDTGVPITDGQWYNLYINRINGVVGYYIGTPSVAPVLVATDTVNYTGALTICRDIYCRTSGSGMTGDGFWIDSFGRLCQR